MNKLIAIALTLFLFSTRIGLSQDLFEFQVYDAGLVPKGGWEIDFHVTTGLGVLARSDGLTW